MVLVHIEGTCLVALDVIGFASMATVVRHRLYRSHGEIEMHNWGI